MEILEATCRCAKPAALVPDLVGADLVPKDLVIDPDQYPVLATIGLTTIGLATIGLTSAA
jgi:hypothetical protein